MQVRSLEVDFSDIEPHWSEYIEFAQSMNATSTVPAYVEPYLSKVLARARKELAGKSPALNRDISTFIRQEMEHCRQHVAFNEMLIRSYPEIVPQLERYGADYERFLQTRSLQFNVAYAEGFESMIGLTTPAAWEAREALWAKSDPRVEALWKWHLAEEHEHREVMFNVYQGLFGKGLCAYLYRIFGFLYAMIHIGAHIRRTKKLLLQSDQARMGEEAWKKRSRPAKSGKGSIREVMSRLAHILSPNYDPSKRQPLQGVEAILAQTVIKAPIAEAPSGAR
jgi:uncharacterized protein